MNVVISIMIKNHAELSVSRVLARLVSKLWPMFRLLGPSVGLKATNKFSLSRSPSGRQERRSELGLKAGIFVSASASVSSV